MATIFDYMDNMKYESIYDYDFTELDFLILTELSYLPFDGMVSSEMNPSTECRLLEIYPSIDKKITTMTTKERLLLLEKAYTHKRFKNIKLSGYINDIDSTIEKQFSAVIFKIKPQTYVLAFRGTDDTIIGWKEDFHMTYMKRIPSQKSAVHYLEKAMAALPGKFILVGHSKGGNLAAYSASQVDPSYQERIQGIYSYDAPGLHHSIIHSEQYKSINHKVNHYVPQGSIVGMMMETPKEIKIVKSNALGGFAQHNTFTWHIEQRGFVLLDKPDTASVQTDKTLKSWLASVPDEELKDFFDLFFGLVQKAGITSIDDFYKWGNVNKFLSIFKNATNLSNDEKDRLFRLSALLINMRYKHWYNDISIPKMADIGHNIKSGMKQLTQNLLAKYKK
ncbi:MAG: DUF2974 domain-containing protein [Streptococcus sp.]|nr:DUF2974 domain-containing protein [Streptococcus sp.]